MNPDEQYKKVCGPKFEDISQDVKETNKCVKEIHRYIFQNGLQEKVVKNSVYIGIMAATLGAIGTAFAWQVISRWL